MENFTTFVVTLLTKTFSDGSSTVLLPDLILVFSSSATMPSGM